MKAMGLGWSIVLVWTTVLTAGSAASAGDLTITPGRSIGRTFLGESRALVMERLGQPDQTSENRGGLCSDTWFNSVPGVYYTMISYRAGRVVQITTDNGKFKTPDGFSVSSTLPQVRCRFRHLRQFTSHDPAHPVRTFTRFYDPKAGIAFKSMNGASYFDEVTVYRPGRRMVEETE